MNIIKNKQIIKEGLKVFEKAEVDKTEVQKQINLLETEKIRRLAEITAEFDVKIQELQIYLK